MNPSACKSPSVVRLKIHIPWQHLRATQLESLGWAQGSAFPPGSPVDSLHNRYENHWTGLAMLISTESVREKIRSRSLVISFYQRIQFSLLILYAKNTHLSTPLSTSPKYFKTLHQINTVLLKTAGPLLTLKKKWIVCAFLETA